MIEGLVVTLVEQLLLQTRYVHAAIRNLDHAQDVRIGTERCAAEAEYDGRSKTGSSHFCKLLRPIVI
jgi:hypothetical protein